MSDSYRARAGDRQVRNAAWSYPWPSPLARWIRSHVAFDSGSGTHR
ncbi:DUF427 domain-containing protein [Paenarthrobacter sp. Z7-10]|nr:DUF427 domain-containing protein [Paenarthrobacter sp. Z7-10]